MDPDFAGAFAGVFLGSVHQKREEAVVLWIFISMSTCSNFRRIPILKGRLGVVFLAVSPRGRVGGKMDRVGSVKGSSRCPQQVVTPLVARSPAPGEWPPPTGEHLLGGQILLPAPSWALARACGPDLSGLGPSGPRAHLKSTGCQLLPAGPGHPARLPAGRLSAGRSAGGPPAGSRPAGQPGGSQPAGWGGGGRLTGRPAGRLPAGTNSQTSYEFKDILRIRRHPTNS